MEGLPPWPKGPFPARYLAPAVVERLRASATLDEALGRLDVARIDDGDPFVAIVPGELGAIRERLAGLAVTATRWRAGRKDQRRPGATGIAIVGSADPIDALVAVGVASPEHGIGTAAMVRFVTTLRGMCAQSSIESLAEDHLGLALTPRTAEHALRIASRARELCAPLGERITVEALADGIVRDESLALDWA